MNEDMVEILNKILTKFKDSANFCQHVCSRDMYGNHVSSDNLSASSFDILGAMFYFKISEGMQGRIFARMDKISKNLYNRSTIQVNDQNGHAAILKVIKRTIQELIDD